nr:lipid II flippase MurJ [Actinomyces culturomici]
MGADGAEPRPAEPAPQARASLLRASAIMASGTMVSRILGFVRSAMLLAAIGAAGGGVSAAFQTANTLPNTVFNLLASGIFDAVLVPQIVGALKRKHDGETYVNRLLTLAGTLLFVVTIVSMVAAPLLVVITAAGYDSQIRTLAILFALLCLPQLFFYGLYNLLGELLNARGVFGPYMWAPVVNNIVGIAGLAAFLFLWGGTEDRIDVGDFTAAQFWVLGGSATLGVIAQALILFIPMRRAGVKFTPDFHFRGTHFGSTSKVAGWTFATLGVSQIGVLSTNNLAALADAYAKAHDGVIIAGINAYATAFMIFMVPQSLITVSLTTAIFTRMAEAVADGDDRGVAANYTLGIRTITSLTLLAAAILMAGAAPMMQMVLYSKTNQSIVMAYAWILVALMPGVASTGLVLMSQRVFFAYEDVKPVFLMGIGPTIVQVIVGWTMYVLTGAAWWVAAAALGETACRLVQGVIAVVWVSRRNRFVDRAGLLRSYAIFLASAVIAGAVAFGALRLVGVETIAATSLVRFGLATAKMVLVSVVASLVYMLALRLLGPADSARTIAPLLVRLRVPAPLRALLAAPLPANGDGPGDND